MIDDCSILNTSTLPMGFHHPTESAPLLLPPPPRRMREAGNSRSGRWTDKEEKFARYIIQCYATGLLQLDHGVTLRSYLAKKLRCLPSRITKKFKGNDDSNIQGAQRLQKDSSKVSPRDIQISQQNLLTLEKEFLQELSIHTAQTSEVLSGGQPASWQPEPSSILCCGVVPAVPITSSSNAGAALSPPAPAPQQNTYDASRDRLLNMSLGLNSILGSLLQRACTENHAIMQQQQTAETMNALVGAFASGQALSVPVTPTSCTSTPYLSPPVPNFSNVLLPPNSPRLPLTPSLVAPPPTTTMIDNCWASAVAAAAQNGNNNNAMQYGSTHPSQLARVLTESLVSTNADALPRVGILPRPSVRFQPEHILHAPTLSTHATSAVAANEYSSSAAAPAAAPVRRKKPKTPPRQVVAAAAAREEAPKSPLSRQPEEMEDADAFLSFVQSVNHRSTDHATTKRDVTI